MINQFQLLAILYHQQLAILLPSILCVMLIIAAAGIIWACLKADIKRYNNLTEEEKEDEWHKNQ